MSENLRNTEHISDRVRSGPVSTLKAYVTDERKTNLHIEGKGDRGKTGSSSSLSRKSVSPDANKESPTKTSDRNSQQKALSRIAAKTLKENGTGNQDDDVAAGGKAEKHVIAEKEEEVKEEENTEGKKEEDGEETWGLIPFGLRNRNGENNCFLNSIVQVLWHLDVFRRDFLQLSGHACLRNSCIFCALEVLFTQFKFTEASCLPPDVLREAMSISFSAESRFQLGEMDDAAECFEKILSRIHYHVTGSEESESDICCQLFCITHRKFVTRVTEEMACQCGAIYGRITFNQTVCYVSTNSIMEKACRSFLRVRDDQMTTRKDSDQSQPTLAEYTSANLRNRSGHLFGNLLRDAMDSDDGDNCRTCPQFGCRGSMHLRRTMVHCPEVLSVGLIWESERPSTQEIETLANLISTFIDPNNLFDRVDSSLLEGKGSSCEWNGADNADEEKDGRLLRLNAIVCYYGKHYSTFLFDTTHHEWISIDDSAITQIGQWLDVLKKCVRGRYQPLLLIYAKPHSTQIPRHLVPKVTWFPPSPSPYSKITPVAAKTTTVTGLQQGRDLCRPPRPSSARPPKKKEKKS